MGVGRLFVLAEDRDARRVYERAERRGEAMEAVPRWVVPVDLWGEEGIRHPTACRRQAAATPL